MLRLSTPQPFNTDNAPHCVVRLCLVGFSFYRCD
uniref:Uncharacterized protein n=1 Tax=Inoviridae sp. ct1ro12 TaxID=2826756 RepID=A0A8S5QZL5_9VIRU|nr:MAG TPA: hypothetical protein [Inoviridae sp. ct1ro12]